MESRKDIFISYKNDGEGNNFAARICSDLERLGYEVYYNPNEQHAGSFPDRLKNAVESCKDFLLILTQPCLEQLIRHDKIDWVREELLTAYRNDKNIIPILMPGVSMPKDKDDMPKDLQFLPDKDAVSITEPYNRSPLELLLGWVKSAPEMGDRYKYTYQSNDAYDINEDLQTLEKKTQSNDVGAMYELAMMYLYQLGEQDNEKAAFWLKKILSSNDEELKSHALSRIAAMYFSGTMPGEEQSFEKAFQIREDASKYNRNAAMINAAMRRIGSGYSFNYQEVEDSFRKISEADSITIKEQADFYLTYGRFSDAIELYMKIQNKMPAASYQLGMLYKLGVQTEPPTSDCYRAESHFRRAANKGHIMAAYELGMLYYNPPLCDFEKDFEQAVKYFKIAADAGIAESQYKLGWMYRFGLGCEVNIEQSIKYELMAAEQGHTGGYGQLAYLYQIKGFTNYHKAFKYAKLAADAGYAHGAFVCGNFLFLGRGCVANESEALKYYKFAYQHGSYEAKIMIEKLEKRKNHG